jgi:mannose-6-phosphate isomerase-like protein (cupin superfamily)
MEHRDLKDFVRFSPEGVRRFTVFETERLWSEVLCFDRNQHVGPVRDPRSDGLFTILAGEAVFLVDRRRARLRQWATVLVPAGAEVSVTNASADPLVLLLVAAPPPSPRAVSG